MYKKHLAVDSVEKASDGVPTELPLFNFSKIRRKRYCRCYLLSLGLASSPFFRGLSLCAVFSIRRLAVGLAGQERWTGSRTQNRKSKRSSDKKIMMVVDVGDYDVGATKRRRALRECCRPKTTRSGVGLFVFYLPYSFLRRLCVRPAEDDWMRPISPVNHEYRHRNSVSAIWHVNRIAAEVVGYRLKQTDKKLTVGEAVTFISSPFGERKISI